MKTIFWVCWFLTEQISCLLFPCSLFYYTLPEKGVSHYMYVYDKYIMMIKMEEREGEMR